MTLRTSGQVRSSCSRVMLPTKPKAPVGARTFSSYQRTRQRCTPVFQSIILWEKFDCLSPVKKTVASLNADRNDIVSSSATAGFLVQGGTAIPAWHTVSFSPVSTLNQYARFVKQAVIAGQNLTPSLSHDMLQIVLGASVWWCSVADRRKNTKGGFFGFKLQNPAVTHTHPKGCCRPRLLIHTGSSCRPALGNFLYPTASVYKKFNS